MHPAAHARPRVMHSKKRKGDLRISTNKKECAKGTVVTASLADAVPSLSRTDPDTRLRSFLLKRAIGGRYGCSGLLALRLTAASLIAASMYKQGPSSSTTSSSPRSLRLRSRPPSSSFSPSSCLRSAGSFASLSACFVLEPASAACESRIFRLCSDFEKRTSSLFPCRRARFSSPVGTILSLSDSLPLKGSLLSKPRRSS